MSDATTGTASAGQSQWVDPYGAFNFRVTIGGVAVAHFVECSGPDIRIETVEYREAGLAQVVHHIPTITTYGEITLRQGLTSGMEMWDWFMAAVEGDIRPLPVSIILLDTRGTTPVTQFDLERAIPVRATGSHLRATAREVYIQEFGLKYETIERVRPSNA